jgi:hypothetical protein
MNDSPVQNRFFSRKAIFDEYDYFTTKTSIEANASMVQRVLEAIRIRLASLENSSQGL